MADVGDVTGAGAGFRGAVVEEVVEVVGFGFAAAEVALDRVEVRRDAAVIEVGRRLSSSDTEDAGRWAVEDTAEVRLAAVEVVFGRVGGLLSPPVAVAVRAEDAVGFVAVEDVAGRRAVVVVVVDVVAGFFAAGTAALAPVAVVGFFPGAVAGAGDSDFSAEVSTGTAATGSPAAAGWDSAGEAPGASAGASTGASPC